MRRRILRVMLILLLLPPVLAAVAGWLVAPAYLQPIRRDRTPDLIREADASVALTHADREPFEVRAPDGVLLSGWKVTPRNPNGSWVLLFHGVADNRVGVTGQAEVLLRAGYGVVMMDARAHGASEGSTATYGWLERKDTRAVIDRLFQDARQGCLASQYHGTGSPCPMPTIPPRWGFTRKNLSDACSSFSGLTGAVPSRAQANKKTDKADTRNPSGAARLRTVSRRRERQHRDGLDS